MIISHKIDEFFLELFPRVVKLAGDRNLLAEEAAEYFRVGPYKPKVWIEGDLLFVEADLPKINSEKKDIDKVTELCEKRRYALAKPILEKLIRKNPGVSEYHRVYGQIFFDEKEFDKSADCLLDALRWDPRNYNALIMMGNIFAGPKNDSATAMKYYDLALGIRTDDYITLNNIGANLLKVGKTDEGMRYLEIAYEINPDYANSAIGLALGYRDKEQHEKAFRYAAEAFNKAGNKKELKNYAGSLLQDSAKKMSDEKAVDDVLEKLRSRLAYEIEKPILLEQDDNIGTPAKLEIAEYRGRDEHIIKFKSKEEYLQHLICHELGHVRLIIEARQNNANKAFAATGDNLHAFKSDYEGYAKRMMNRGYAAETVDEIQQSLYNGLNLQLYNAPLDLIIEKRIYEEYRELRGLQFLSLEKLFREGIEAVTHTDSRIFPEDIVSKSKILNYLNALLMRDLFTLDLTGLYGITKSERKQAEEFYQEFREIENGFEPGFEYELIARWGSRLGLSKYFELVPEKEFLGDNAVKNLTDRIKKDFDEYWHKEPPDRMKGPVDYGDDPAGQMAVIMYCVDALNTFRGMSTEEVKKVAFEIGLLGTTGINPSDKERRFNLGSLPGKKFTALQLLAFMYVSWKLVKPDLDTGLNFEKEYEAAKKMTERE